MNNKEKHQVSASLKQSSSNFVAILKEVQQINAGAHKKTYRKQSDPFYEGHSKKKFSTSDSEWLSDSECI